MDEIYITVMAIVFLSPAIAGYFFAGLDIWRGQGKRRGLLWKIAFSSLYVAYALWHFGRTFGGLDPVEECQRAGGWDEAYWQQHGAELRRSFPLSVPCSSELNLIPMWLNPSIAALVIIGMGCAIYLIFLAWKGYIASSPGGDDVRNGDQLAEG